MFHKFTTAKGWAIIMEETLRKQASKQASKQAMAAPPSWLGWGHEMAR
jgi:hypothetical protein